MTIRLPTPTDPDVRHVLNRQVLVMFTLTEEVLFDVTIDECLWRSSDQSWTVHQRSGRWFGEVDEEPPDLPMPSLAWTMWHPIWWLRVLLAHSRNAEIPVPESVEWPGPRSTLSTIRKLWSEWIEFVAALDDDQLRSSELTRFPYEDDRPFVYVAGWASMELTKNLSEMCVLRRLVKTSPPR